MLRKLGLCACALALLASAADAGPLPSGGLDSDEEGWFYNRAGATVAVVTADQEACTAFGLEAVPYVSTNTAVTAQYGLVGVLTAAAMDAAAEGKRKTLADDCMIGRGYRRFRTEDRNLAAFTERFNALSGEAQTALVSAETPSEGVLARQWVNSYWIQQEGDAAATDAPRSILVSRVPATRLREWDPVESRNRMELGPNDALVIVSLHSPTARASVRFIRESGVDGTDDPVRVRGRGQPVTPYVEPQLFLPRDTSQLTRRELSALTQHVYLYVVPAGTYSLSAASVGTLDSEFCLGAPYVDLRPGSVVFLGSVDVIAGERGGNPAAPPAPFGIHVSLQDMEMARSVLARQQEFAARLEAAQYQNGHGRGCSGTTVYGLDVPGAPWAPRGKGLAPAGSEAPASDPATAPAADTSVAPPAEQPSEPSDQAANPPPT